MLQLSVRPLMHRKVILFATLLHVVVFANVMLCVGTEVAWLGELVPWPMLATGFAAKSLILAETPQETIVLGGMSAYARFGLLPIGSGLDPGISFALLEDDDVPPLLRLDANNDEDLSNDPWLSYSEQEGPRKFTWFLTITPEYETNGTVSRVPYHIVFVAEYDYDAGGYECYYAGYSHRSGLVNIDGATYAIAVTSLVSTGLYSELSTLVVAVDLDQDGFVDTLPYSHEAFGPGEPIDFPTGKYRISWASDDGRILHLEREGEAEPRPVIARGKPAPGFEAVTIQGESVSIPSRLNEVTVLLFLSSISDGDCPSCGENAATVNFSRLESIQASLSNLAKEGSISLVVIVDADISDSLIPESEPTAYVVFDPAINRLYRRSFGVGAFVIDQEGIIVAMDEAWSTFGCTRPHGAYSQLRTSEIRAVVERLLQQ